MYPLLVLCTLVIPMVSRQLVLARNTNAYPLPQRPFLTVWNAPVSRCSHTYGVDLDLSAFDFVVNPDKAWVGQFMAIFYRDDIGLYPYYTTDGKSVNGGIPQLVNLKQHLTKVRSDINKAIPDSNFSGLAVIDWEPWRPLWIRNWDKKAIYKEASENVVRKQHPDWNATKVKHEAIRQFEGAARAMMEQTLLVARQLRPRGHWGYYEFPECYNYDGDPDCNPTTKEANDRLVWLFNASSSIFPSAYLHGTNTTKHKSFVFGQITEAMRIVGKLSARGATLPIFLYSRYEYGDDLSRGYYIKEDVNTVVRQAADLGTSGVVFWGDNYSQNSSATCKKLKKFIDTILGPLVKEVTTFAINCSMELCHNHGRCVTVAPPVGPYLHKNIISVKDIYYNSISKYVLRFDKGKLPRKKRIIFNGGKSSRNPFPGYSCKCYDGWSGEHCDQQFTYKEWKRVRRLR